MPRIRFVLHDGTERTVESAVGTSVMQAAVDHFVPGIIGDCGGNCSCATCHGYVDEPFFAKLPPKSEDESIMLEGALSVEENSRLTCQIELTEELDGIVIRIPESQF